MSPIAKGMTTEYPRADTESSSFEHHDNELFIHALESEDFAEFVKKTKATWFCEVAEA
jgi:hypothetical protein